MARITEAELLALLISRKLITEASAGSLADDLEHISRRLGSLLAANLPGRAKPEDAFSFRWKGISPTDPLTFKIVTSALLQGKLLTFCYYSPTASDCTMRTVEPHHMVNYMGNWHLIAFCHLRNYSITPSRSPLSTTRDGRREGVPFRSDTKWRNDWRDFMLGRMTLTQVEITAFQFRPGEEWRPHLANTYGIFQNRKRFNVVLRFTPERSRWVKRELWHEGQGEVIEADGSLVLTIPVSHETEIMMEILKHGSQVEVIEPQWLRDMVIEEIESALKRYRG